MSAAYEFRKIYADCVTPGGEVCVLYLNYLRLAGVWTRRASVEWYTADGARRFTHGTGRPALVDADTPLDALPLRVEVPGGWFSLEVAPVLGAWVPEEPPPVDALHWQVKAMRTRARARWGDRTWEGTGYVDYVRITRPTRVLGFRTLRWGRVHLPDRTVVLEHLDTADGARWDPGVEWSLESPAPRPLPGPATLGPDGDGEVPLADGALALSPLRVLHDGDAFDEERVPRAVDRWLCNAVGGPTWETRWYGTARHGGAEATAVYESVRFG